MSVSPSMTRTTTPLPSSLSHAASVVPPTTTAAVTAASRPMKRRTFRPRRSAELLLTLMTTVHLDSIAHLRCSNHHPCPLASRHVSSHVSDLILGPRETPPTGDAARGPPDASRHGQQRLSGFPSASAV